MNKYSSEYSLFTGNTHKILQNLQKDNPNYNIGITKNASSFVSKKGNNCVSFDLYMNDNLSGVNVENILIKSKKIPDILI